jgi:hypothetical protein
MPPPLARDDPVSAWRRVDHGGGDRNELTHDARLSGAEEHWARNTTIAPSMATLASVAVARAYSRATP